MFETSQVTWDVEKCTLSIIINRVYDYSNKYAKLTSNNILLVATVVADRNLLENVLSQISENYEIREDNGNLMVVIESKKRSVHPVKFKSMFIFSKDIKDDDVLKLFFSGMKPLSKLMSYSKGRTANINVRDIFVNIKMRTLGNVFDYELSVIRKRDKRLLYNFKVDSNGVTYMINKSFIKSRGFDNLYKIVRILTLVTVLDDNFDGANIGDDVFSKITLNALNKSKSENIHINYIKSVVIDKFIPEVVKADRGKLIEITNDNIMVSLLENGDVCIYNILGTVRGMHYYNNPACMDVGSFLLGLYS